MIGHSVDGGGVSSVSMLEVFTQGEREEWKKKKARKGLSGQTKIFLYSLIYKVQPDKEMNTVKTHGIFSYPPNVVPPFSNDETECIKFAVRFVFVCLFTFIALTGNILVLHVCIPLGVYQTMDMFRFQMVVSNVCMC